MGPLISIWKAVHQDSIWNRGKRQLGNGLLKTAPKSFHVINFLIFHVITGYGHEITLTLLFTSPKRNTFCHLLFDIMISRQRRNAVHIFQVTNVRLNVYYSSCIGRLLRCDLRAICSSEPSMLSPIYQNHFWQHCLWHVLGFDDCIRRPPVLYLWFVLWSAELRDGLGGYSIHPRLVDSIGVSWQNLALHCKVLLRSFVRVMRKDFLEC